VLDVGIRKEFAARRLLEPLADRRAGFVIERNEASALVGHRQQLRPTQHVDASGS
jgi:hypothetical protein